MLNDVIDVYLSVTFFLATVKHQAPHPFGLMIYSTLVMPPGLVNVLIEVTVDATVDIMKM